MKALIAGTDRKVSLFSNFVIVLQNFVIENVLHNCYINKVKDLNLFK